MPAGFQLINTDANVISIDENYNNLFLVEQGVGGVIPPAGNYFNPLVAIMGPNYNYYTHGSAVPGDTRWFVFDQLHGWMGTNVGFQVFNAGGGLVFDSGRFPMRIAGAYPDLGGGYNAIGIPAGRSYACVMGSVGGRWVEGSIKAGGANWRNFEGEDQIGVRVNGGLMEWNWYTRWYSEWISDTQEFAQGTNWRYSNVPASGLVLDVTNYF